VPLLTSKRERRLWLWALALVVAIYSTLGLARTLAGELRERELIDGAFFVGLFMLGVAVAVQGLKKRPDRDEVGIALAIAGVYLIVLLRMLIPEERSHLMEYSVVALFVHEALLERARHRPVQRPALLAILITSFVGVLDECIQLFLPDRVFDYRDILFNLLAAVMAVSASAALRWARRRRWRRRPAS